MFLKLDNLKVENPHYGKEVPKSRNRTFPYDWKILCQKKPACERRNQGKGKDYPNPDLGEDLSPKATELWITLRVAHLATDEDSLLTLYGVLIRESWKCLAAGNDSGVEFGVGQDTEMRGLWVSTEFTQPLGSLLINTRQGRMHTEKVTNLRPCNFGITFGSFLSSDCPWLPHDVALTEDSERTFFLMIYCIYYDVLSMENRHMKVWETLAGEFLLILFQSLFIKRISGR